MTTKSHTLAYSGLTSLDRCSVSVRNPLVELDSFCEVFDFFRQVHPAHGKTEK